MQFITFIVTYPFIWLLSLLPMRILYLISDFFFFILYYVVGYRKKVVYNNIQLAFPEKSDIEIKNITKKFFKHFTDLIFESIKSFTISKNEMQKRYVYKNIDVINTLAKQGRSIALMGSHHNNWELSFGLPLVANIACYGAYTKIQNKYFEKVIKSSRMRFGYDGVYTTIFTKTIQERVKNNIQSLYILLSDQSPQLRKTRHWATFLNNFVPVHTGAEILAKKYNFAVVNMTVTKLKRGFYEAEFELLTEDPSQYNNFDLTERYLQITEAHIQKQPEFYLWSHKRFKHKNKYSSWLKNHKK
ncbi:lysophospholipid acyltransferase family protein [Tenacibaculum sp. IB213877]|uniref:lysophospholipid acyltransferase family protein n=1 Tax=Tenacibaculum sp. IB213877 TaxID=3097351 RepID=UPI002A5AE80C|nr:lysophospholipid acyltransferase family protein [Tenacibaculum sp. IB213877]MDY0781491.1 lysophospholipid acyltransferase family protein [Tenacibaculum sp. IB213877]